MEPVAKITRRGELRVRGGHPWIYRSDVAEVGAAAGSVVRVQSMRGAALGRALYSDRSQIALRFLTHDDRAVNATLLRERLEAALVLRAALEIDADAYRLVHAEADQLPSLVVDRYGDVLVLQALSQGMDRLLPTLVPLLVERLAPRGILARHDSSVRELEGLSREVVALYGEVPDTVVVRDGGVHFELDLRAGQKTGLFLDQRENRAVAARSAHGRALDVFSYHGAFALQMAARADEVVAVEISAAAAQRIAGNAQRNRFANVRAVTANAFDWLRAADERRERFDTIVLDPPAFAKSRAAVAKALGGYKELNLRALRMLAPNGTLVTASCSHHVDEAAFGAMLASAAADAGVRVAVIERRGQSLDHPVILGIPETRYLKCFVLRRLS